jgi:hypothetical protein
MAGDQRRRLREVRGNAYCVVFAVTFVSIAKQRRPRGEGVSGLSPDISPSEKDWPHHAILINRCSHDRIEESLHPRDESGLLDPARSQELPLVFGVVVVVVVMMVIIVVMMVMVIIVVMMVMMIFVVMMVIVSEFHVWVCSTLVMVTRSSAIRKSAAALGMGSSNSPNDCALERAVSVGGTVVA